MPIAEIELELLEGSPDALYNLALELDKLAPLRIETRSKSALGYALASGQAPAWHKASGARPRPAHHGRGGACARSCAAACSTGAPTRRPPSTAAIPKASISCASAIRRLRSAFSVFGHLIERERAHAPVERGQADHRQLRAGARLGRVQHRAAGADRRRAAGRPDLAAPARGRAGRAAARLRGGARRDRLARLHPLSARAAAAGSRRAAGASTPPSRERTGSTGRSWRSPTRCSPSATARRCKLGRDFAKLSAAERHRRADRAQEAALRLRVLRGPLPQEGHQALPRLAQADAGQRSAI